MEPGDKIIDVQGKPWRVGERIGSGGFAEVYEASSEEHPSAAIKLIRKDQGAERELLFQDDLEGIPNVVPVLASGEWEDYWVLAMPRAEKSLRARLEERPSLDLNEVVGILEDLAVALVGMAGRVVHRDIKPENILLLDGRWCFADFGISRYAEATTAPDTRKFALTPQYAAPEQWREQRATSATDVYATGVVAYEVLAGAPPFGGPAGPDFRLQHLEQDPLPIPGLPPSMQSLVHECLYKGQEARPRPQNLLERVRNRINPPSQAAAALREANVVAVRRKAEEERQKSVVRSAEERRAELWNAADRGFANLVSLLGEHILENAPASNLDMVQAPLTCNLNEASLTVAYPKSVGIVSDGSTQLPFEVAQYAAIRVTAPLSGSDSVSRSHSLWYCDAQELGAFRWYETAFMNTPGAVRVKPVRDQPFHLDPGKDASLALGPGVEVVQVAWPYTPVDQGQESDFVDRWIGWFAQAAQGQLREPSRMPERSVKGSWRRGDGPSVR